MRCITGVTTILLALTGATATAAISASAAERVAEAAAVLKEVHEVPETDIPQELWERAECVVVIPSVKKAAFIFGGEYGKGLLTCRKDGAWTAPAFMELRKASWGFQIGAQSIDLVLLVMNERGMEKMLGNKISLGIDASVAAGPVGRSASASTDLQLKAEVLSYSRTQGLFAGIDLSGGVLRPDKDENARLYGRNVTAREVVLDGVARAPAETEAFMAALPR